MTDQLDFYQTDAFAERPFTGNPAGVVSLKQWLDTKVMQAIAEENNLPETAFFVASGDGFYIRWFTPGCEIDLCGHATPASAYVLFNKLGYPADKAARQMPRRFPVRTRGAPNPRG